MSQSTEGETREFLGVSRRYPALSLLSQVIIAFGVVISIIGAVQLVVLLANIGEASELSFALATLPLATLLVGLVVAANGQLLKVFMDIETNTRRASAGG